MPLTPPNTKLMTDDDMLFSLNYDEAQGWIKIQATGHFDAQVALDAFRAAVPLAQEHHCYFLLFDTRESQPVESYERGFDFSKHFSEKTGVTSEYRCAVVYDPDRYHPMRAKLMETVVADEAQANLKWFTELDPAAAWLKTNL